MVDFKLYLTQNNWRKQLWRDVFKDLVLQPTVFLYGEEEPARDIIRDMPDVTFIRPSGTEFCSRVQSILKILENHSGLYEEESFILLFNPSRREADTLVTAGKRAKVQHTLIFVTPDPAGISHIKRRIQATKDHHPVELSLVKPTNVAPDPFRIAVLDQENAVVLNIRTWKNLEDDTQPMAGLWISPEGIFIKDHQGFTKATLTGPYASEIPAIVSDTLENAGVRYPTAMVHVTMHLSNLD